MREYELDEIYDYLVDNKLFTSDEISLVTNINGWCIESFNDMCYARYGYNDVILFINEQEGELE